ncbi:MAG TPA: dihydrolipoamide acetyltransferase family protein [Streptosporangiaceae bacterium]|nr:dihydrolipoamide acetyltransferase family protein [Streptosporangiaceae bacterium]
MPDFLLPDLGEGLEDAELTAWHVRVGDHVAVDQVVAEVETAKAAVEVPIPFAGTVTAVHAEPGTTLPVGAPLISVTADGPGTGQVGQASGNVLVGYGTRPFPRRARGPRGRAVSAATAPAPAPATTPAMAPAPAPAPAWTGRVPVISPIVRKLAREAGLDLARIPGTGPDGLVLRRDVNQAIAALSSPRPGAQLGPRAAEVRIPIRGVRRTAAEKLTRSRREIPEATVWVDADATGLVAARAALNAQAPRAPVSLLALLARFAVAGLRRWPELNAHIENEEIVIPAHVHLGFAVQTERGLVVPVIRDAHLMSVRELAAALGRQTAAARAGRLAPADLTGGTITVNNYGVFGVDGSAAIINHPEVAILGLGRIIDRPWVVDGQLAVRKVTELTLAFDHRVCDGGTAGGYLRYVADCVESPLLALGDL